jgi:hypothetical protein
MYAVFATFTMQFLHLYQFSARQPGLSMPFQKVYAAEIKPLTHLAWGLAGLPL